MAFTWQKFANIFVGGKLRLGKQASIIIQNADNTESTVDLTDLGVVAGLTATATEINRACDVSARLVAAGSTLAVTVAAHDGKTILLDTAAGSTCTLPAATGSGARIRFAVSVKPTSNQHRITVTGNDAFYGSINILDLDAAAQAAYAAGSDADQLNLNGTTTGGQIGDFVTVEDVAADKWQVFGQAVCPAGSNPATPFATGQVT